MMGKSWRIRLVTSATVVMMLTRFKEENRDIAKPQPK